MKSMIGRFCVFLFLAFAADLTTVTAQQPSPLVLSVSFFQDSRCLIPSPNVTSLFLFENDCAVFNDSSLNMNGLSSVQTSCLQETNLTQIALFSDAVCSSTRIGTRIVATQRTCESSGDM